MLMVYKLAQCSKQNKLVLQKDASLAPMAIDPSQAVTGNKTENTNKDQDINLNTVMEAFSVPNSNDGKSDNNNEKVNPPTTAVGTTSTDKLSDSQQQTGAKIDDTR